MKGPLATALWSTRFYLIPELKHFILFGFLSVLAMLLELAAVLLVFDLLTHQHDYEGALALEIEPKDHDDVPRYVAESYPYLSNIVEQVTGSKPD